MQPWLFASSFVPTLPRFSEYFCISPSDSWPSRRSTLLQDNCALKSEQFCGWKLLFYLWNIMIHRHDKAARPQRCIFPIHGHVFTGKRLGRMRLPFCAARKTLEKRSPRLLPLIHLKVIWTSHCAQLFRKLPAQHVIVKMFTKIPERLGGLECGNYPRACDLSRRRTESATGPGASQWGKWPYSQGQRAFSTRKRSDRFRL